MIDASYIAGFFDADGYITATKFASNQEPTVSIGFTNSVKSLLEEIEQFLFKELGVKGH